MEKVTAGLLVGALAGAAYGLTDGWGEPAPIVTFTTVLGRASQGILTGVLTGYLTKRATPLWMGAIVGAALGAAFGTLAALADGAWVRAIPFGIAVGAICGLAAARVSRARPDPAIG